MAHTWSFQSAPLTTHHGFRFRIARDSEDATYAQVIQGWQDDTACRSVFIDALAGVPYSALRWETPPVTAQTLHQAFEFVVLDSPGLAPQADVSGFAEHFTQEATSGVVAFPNLGKDAVLVVPCPLASHSVYAHLANFLRGAPDIQRHALWQTVGNVMASRIGHKPVWLNTAGAGVSWLHVRLDDRPKYYGYAPYRSA